MLKPCLLAGGLLLTAIAGTASAAAFNFGGFGSPRALSELVTAGTIDATVHSYGDDGMVFSGTPTAQCVGVGSAPNCTAEPTFNWTRTAGLADRAAILSAVGLPSSFLTSESFVASHLGTYLLSLDLNLSAVEVREAVAAAGFSFADDLGVGGVESMPEPMSLLLVGTGLAGLSALIRRRRA